MSLFVQGPTGLHELAGAEDLGSHLVGGKSVGGHPAVTDSYTERRGAPSCENH